MRQLKISKSITNRSSEALDKYLVEIGREPMVSIDEEIELAQKIRKGGREGERAKDKLVKANLRFVVSVAKQYQHQIKFFSNIQTLVKADAHAENQDDGGIDGTAHQIHLPAASTGGLQIIDASAETRFWTRTANKFFCSFTFFSLFLIVADSFSFIEFNNLIKEVISLTFSAF